MDGDGAIDLITGKGAGGDPLVRVFAVPPTSPIIVAIRPSLLASFIAYDVDFSGGVRVAASDINGDGLADIITAPGQGGGPHVRGFDAESILLPDDPVFAALIFATRDPFPVFPLVPPSIRDVFVADPSFTGGIFVAATINLERRWPPL